MPKRPQLLTCPKCKHRYLGNDPVSDCPCCGYDYREKEGVRWDVLGYLLVILALLSFFLTSSYYKQGLGVVHQRASVIQDSDQEKLPGQQGMAFQSPYQKRSR